MLYSNTFDFWTMAAFEEVGRGGSDYWMDHLRYRADIPDWHRSAHNAYDDDDVVDDIDDDDDDDDSSGPLASPTKGDTLPVDLARWSYDDEAVAGDLEQYRRNLQDIADRISEELSGFEPRTHERPMPSIESADMDVPYAEAKRDVIEATTKLSLKSAPKKKKKPGSISVPKPFKPDNLTASSTPTSPVELSPKSPRAMQDRPMSRGRHATRRDARRG